VKILLDTCTFLWLASDAKELSDQAKVLFQNMDNAVYLSSVSVWEIVVKNKSGKIQEAVRLHPGDKKLGSLLKNIEEATLRLAVNQ
jgi:PIN domain nuclease of toxin-antitoxin system